MTTMYHFGVPSALTLTGVRFAAEPAEVGAGVEDGLYFDFGMGLYQPFREYYNVQYLLLCDQTLPARAGRCLTHTGVKQLGNLGNELPKMKLPHADFNIRVAPNGITFAD